MPFIYRLQKILDFRIRKKEEQLQEVVRAQQGVVAAEKRIEENNQNIIIQRQNMRKAPPQMYETYDNYLKHLYDKDIILQEQLQEAIMILEEEKLKLLELEKAVNVLEKHKEKAKEEYIKEEKNLELKRLSEVAVQRHFAKTKSNLEEEEILSEEERNLLEGNEE